MFDAAVINGNYALGAGLDPSTAFAAEGADSQAAQEYGNVVAVRSGDEKSAKTEALLAALQSQKVFRLHHEHLFWHRRARVHRR